MARRRQETLWIHRWSRPLIAAIAAVGAFGTGYLTLVKWVGATAACPTDGCERVLSSPYATIFGLPLTLFGFLAYGAMFVLAIGPLLAPQARRPSLEKLTWPLLFVGATAMMVFSGYLMYLLTTEIRAVCLYCIASAAMTVAMFVLALLGRRWDDRGQVAFIGVIVAVVALVGTLGLYAPIQGSATAAGRDTVGEVGPPVQNASGPAEVALAQHLTDIGAKMYGAYWCPHCHDQKELFGQTATAEIPYIECAPDGRNPQTALCQSVEEVRGYPTWEINGEFLPGAQSLETLANASGYTGPMDFAN